MDLGEFLTANREAIVEDAQRQIDGVAPGRDARPELETFLGAVVALLRGDESGSAAITAAAQTRGEREQRSGLRIDQLVHEFGTLCSAVTGHADRLGEHFEAREYQIFNQALDELIAIGVAEFERSAIAGSDRSTAQRIGSAAHEMRNALTAAIAAFSFIRAGSAPASGRTGEVLDRSLRRIHVLVENLLVDARMQSSNRATPERCAMDALVEEAADSVSLEAAARRVRVVVDVPQPIEVAGNAAMLSSAISNLLHNAVKFTHADGTVTIRLSRTNGRAVVSVEDQCGGLPVGAPERLFAPFVQGATNRDGVGLGLSIVHDVAEWHGGSIRAENRAGAGCVFYLDIPCG